MVTPAAKSPTTNATQRTYNLTLTYPNDTTGRSFTLIGGTTVGLFPSVGVVADVISGPVTAVNSGTTQATFSMDIRLGSGISDGFALALDASGQIVTYDSLILGGNGQDSITAIAVDLNGNFNIAAKTENTAKTGAAGGKYYSPFVGHVTGNTVDVVLIEQEGEASAIAVDLNGNSYIAGTTAGKDFPVYNALQTYPQTLDRAAPNEPMGSGYNGFILKMDPTFSKTIFSTYLGGSKHDYITGIAVDFRGYVYVTGETESIDFPTLGNAADQSSDRNHGNAFLSVLVPAGNELRYSTYFGGAEVDWGFGVAVSPIRNPIAYVVGYTNSDDFPTQSGTANPVVYPNSRQPDTYTSGFVTAFQDPTVDLQLEAITTDLAVPIAGQNLTYTVTVKNLSITDCEDARVSQLLSDNLQFVSAAGASIDNFTGGSLDTTTNTVSVHLGPVMAGREVSYTVTVLVTAAAVISTTATVQAEYDNNSTNNSLTLQQIARPLVSLVVTQAQASENGTPGIFTIVRQGDLSPTLAVKYNLGGNSTNGVNYATLSGTAILTSGTDRVDVVVAPYANTTPPVPGAKTVVLTVQKGINYETGPALTLTGTVNIADVAADVVSLAVPDGVGSKNSGDPVVFTVSRTGDLGQALTVTYNLFGSATNGTDYQISGDGGVTVSGTVGTVTIPANTTNANVVIKPISDAISGQPVLTTTVGIQVVTIAQTLTAPGSGYVLGATTGGNGTILDVNPDTVSVAVINANASASGTTGLMRITRAGDASNLTTSLSVQYTMGGTAISGSDYTALSGVATIPAGSATVDVTVNPILNITGTTDKTAILTLSPTPNASAYTLGAGTTGTVTIFHYAGAIVTVTAPAQVAATATATGTTNGFFIVSRTGPTTLPLTINYSMSGSASSGVDYAPLLGSGTIPVGSANVTIILTPLANGLTSGSETAILTVQPPLTTDYLPGSPSSASVTIINASGVVRPLVSLSVISNDASLTSGSGVLVFRVTRTGDAGKAISVNYATGGSAINGTDYQQLTGAIALPANVTSADIVVTPIWSNTVQPVKVVSIALTPGDDYDLDKSTYGTGSIDFPNNPLISLAVVSGTATTVSGTLDFLVTRDGNSTQAISVNYSTGGSAVNGVDYQPLTGSIAMPAGVTSTHVFVTPIWTAGVKQAQVMTIQLATGSGYALGAKTFGSGSIGYVPWDVVNVSVPVSAVYESGSTNAVFRLTRTGDVTLPITVNYTMGGTAVSGVNYQPVSGSVVIVAGSTSADVAITPINAHSATPVNTVTLNLAEGTGYTAGAAASGQATISSADPTVTLAISGTTAVTQTSGTLVFQVVRTGDISKTIMVNYTLGGNAVSGTDYQPLPATIVMPSGTGTANVFIIPIWTNSGVTKAVSMQLGTGAGYVLGANTADTGTITPVPWDTVTIADALAAVSETGSNGSLSYHVTRTGDLAQPITVNYTTAGTAVSGVNYQPVTGTVTIPATSGSASIQIVPLNANSTTPSNTVLVRLGPGSGYNVGAAAVGSGTITSANAIVTLALNGTNSVTQTSGTLVFRATRGGDLSTPLLLNYTLAGSAANGVDYQSLPGTAVFLAGATTVDIPVRPIWTGGPDKVVSVQLATGSGYVLGSTVSATGAITGVALADVNLSVLAGSVSETGSTGSLSFLVTRTGDLNQPLTFNYTLGGSAVSGVNYQPVTGSVAIPAGTGTGAIAVTPINANLTVPFDTVVVSAASGIGYTTAGVAAVTGTITSANPVVSVIVNGTNTVTQTSGTLTFRVTRGGDISKAAAVNYTMAGSAINGVDYQNLPGTVAFAAGVATVDILVSPIWTGGADKVVTMQLASGSGYVLGSSNTSASATISTVPWGPVNVSVSPGLVSETGSNGNLIFQLTRQGDLAQPVTVHYSMGGSAVSGVNYQPVSGLAVILAGSANVTIPVQPINASSTVPTNTAILTVNAGSGYSVGAIPSATGTISSANPVVGVAVSGTSTVTQTSGTLVFRVTRGGDLSKAVAVSYTLGGSAINGADYQTLPATVAFAAGAATADVLVAPIWTGGPDKVVSIQLGTGSGYVLGSANISASGAITKVALDNVSLSVATGSVSETGSSGSLSFLVTRAGDLNQPLTFNYTLGGSAVSGVNYQPVTGSVSIPAGTGTGAIAVTPINANLTVPFDTVIVSAASGIGYTTAGVAAVTGTITSANSVVSVAVSGTSTVTQTSGTLIFRVTRGGDLSKAVAVNYSLGGSAANGVDYQSLNGTLAFASGSATADILVKPIWTGGPDRVVSVQLGTGSGYVLGSASTSASGAITNVALDGVSLSVTKGVVSETGTDGSLGFLVTRSGDLNQPLTFNYTLGGSAVSGVNYQPVTGSVLIASGTSTAAIAVAPINAGMTVSFATVILNAAAGNGYSGAIPAVTGTINSTNPVATVAISGTSTVTQTSGTLIFRVTRGGDVSKAVAVNYTMAGTAANGSDYQAVPGTLAFDAGAATADILIQPIWTGGPDKVVTIQLAGGTGYTLGSSNTFASGAINNTAFDSVNLSVVTGSVSETGSNGNLSFLVTRAGDLNQPLTVTYSVGGSALSGTNFQPLTGAVLVAAGTSTATIQVVPIDSHSTSPFTTVVLTAYSATGAHYTIGATPTVTGTLISSSPVISVNVTGTNAITQTTGPLTFRVTRGGDPSKALSVNYTLGGSAVSGSDYETLPGTVTFLAGAATADIPIYPIWNNGTIVTKMVTVTLASGAGYVIGAVNTASGTIAPVAWDLVNVSVAPGIVSETGSNGNLNFTVTRNGDVAQPITVNYAMGGTAGSGTNYAPVIGSVSILAGSSNANVAVIPLNNSLTTPYKTVTLSVSPGTDYSAGAVPMASGTILSANPVVSVSLSGTSSVTQTSGTLVFRVSRGGDISKAIAVSYTLGGSGVAGTDYQSLGVSPSIAFAPGATTADILVSPIWTGSLLDKVVSVQLGNGTGYVVDSTAMTVAGTITGTQFDFVNVALSPMSVSETGSNGNLNFQINRTGDLNQPITVTYTMGGTAVSGVNYQPVTGTVTLVSGTGSATVPVMPINAHSTTPSKAVSLTVTSGTHYNVGAVPFVTGTITSENPAVNISVLNSVASQSGSGTIVLQVTRTGDLSKAIAVSYTVGGSATSGDDFVAIPTAIALPAGTGSANIVITPIWGATYKAPKVVTVQLTAGTGYVLGDITLGSGTINFPDFPEINLTVLNNDASQTSGSGVLVFQVTRTGTTAKAITVNYTTAGTAVSGSDYIALPGSVAMAAGVSSTTVTVTPNWSGNPRPVKVFTIQLATGNNYVLGSNTIGSGSIDFVDSPAVNVSVLNSDAMPPGTTGTGSVLFLVSRTGDTSKAITVNFKLAGTATNGTDYYGIAEAITLPAGATNAVVQVIPKWSNTAKTGPDSVTIQLTDGTGYKLGGTTFGSGSIDWPSTPVVSLRTINLIASPTSGSNSITFEVSRIGDLSQPIQVSYALGGNAVYGDDYQASTGTVDPSHTVVLPAGSGTAYVTIVPNWSSLVKPTKLVTIQLGGGAGGYLLSPYTYGQGTINFPGLPEVDLSVISNNAMQGSGSGTVVFRVTRTDTSKAISVNYTMGGSAGNGTDYQLLPLNIALPVGTGTADIVVTPKWSNGANIIKIVSAQLATGVGYVLGPNTYGSGAIDFPNYPEVNLTVISNAATQVSGSLVFRVTCSGTLASAITVPYTLGGVAINGVDYQSLLGSVTLPAGTISSDIVVKPIWSNSPGTGPLDVTVQLGTGGGFILGANTFGSGLIARVPWDVVAVAVPQPIASESGTTALYRITRTGDTTLPIIVNYIMGGTAVNGVNYQPLSGQALIGSGSTSADVVLTPINANVRTLSNTAILTVVSGTYYTVGVPASGTATIISANPWGTVNLTTISNNASQTSGTGLLIFRVTRTGTLSEPMAVPFSLGGDGLSGVDYQPVTASIDNASTIVLPVGVSSTDIVITPIWTNQVKPVKLVSVQLLASGSGYLLGPNTFGQGTIDFPNFPEVNVSVLSNSAQPSSTSSTSAVIFQVTRTGDNSKAVEISISLGGAAVSGVDYQPVTGSIDNSLRVALPAGVSGTQIVITPIWTSQVKPVKLVSIQVNQGSGYVLGAYTYAAGTLNFPNDPVINLNIINAVATQTGTSYLAFQVTRSGDLSKAIAVGYQTGGTAVAGEDYQALPGYVVLSPSVSSVGVVVFPTWSNVLKPSSVMSLQLSQGIGYVLGSQTYGAGSIEVSASSNVSLSVGTNAATSGSGQLVFHVTRSSGLATAISVNYNMGGSAVSGLDYVPVAGAVTLGVGATSADIVVTPIWNASVRPDRVVIVQLTSGVGYALVGNTAGTGTISDTAWDVVNLSVPQPNASESGTTAIFRVTRPVTSNTTRAITVNYTTGGTAVAGLNYQALTGSVVIPAGATSADIIVTPLSDHVNTPDRTLILTLASGQYYTSGSSVSGTATIANVPDNSLVSLLVVSNTASTTSGNLVYRVTRTGVTSAAILVNYTVAGSAVNGVDYELLSGNIALAANVTSADIVVNPIWISTVKLPQVFTVQLGTGVGYDLTGNTFGSGTIVYVPWDTVNLSVPLSATSETGTPAIFRVTRVGDVNKPIMVNYTVAGTAVGGTNYVALTGSAQILASSSSTDVTVIPIPDHVNTPTLSVFLTLAGGSNYTLNAPVSGTATIANVPDNTVSLVVTSRATEVGQNGAFQIRRTGPLTNPLVVKYSVGGTAVPGRDYVTLTGTVTLPINMPNSTVLVKPLVNGASQASPYVRVVIAPSIEYTTAPAGSGTVPIINYTGPVVTATAILPNANVTGTPGAIRISRTGATTAKLLVNYTMTGTAKNGSDYVKLSGSAIIPVGARYLDVGILPINRSQPSGLYSATMTLLKTATCLPGPPSAATVNIRSYGPAPVQVIADSANSSNWEGYGVVIATFVRTGSVSDPLTINYGTAGTAVSGVNFSAVSGVVTIPAGTDRVGVSFNTIDDGRVTPDLTLIVVLKAGPGYTVTAPGQTTLTIKDADLHGPTF